jgi:hypothetical protein
MKKLGIFVIGTIILFPIVAYILSTESILCQLLAALLILVIVLTGDKTDKIFWKTYFSILFPLPKEFME